MWGTSSPEAEGVWKEGVRDRDNKVEREEHWQSEDVSGKKRSTAEGRRPPSQRGHKGLMRGSLIHPFCQTSKRKGQCNWLLLTDKPHKPYKRMKKLLEGQVKKSTLNSALVLPSSMTHLLISCPDLCPRACGSPAAIPQHPAVTCSGSSDFSIFSQHALHRPHCQHPALTWH